MKANERGNAILISAILVFGLTITALGVSRMLVKGLQFSQTQRQFLGLQAHSLCEAGILAWTKEDSTFSTKVYNPAVVLASPSGQVTYNATVSIIAQGSPTPTSQTYSVLAQASLTGADGVSVERMVGATVSCPTMPCVATPSFFAYQGGP